MLCCAVASRSRFQSSTKIEALREELEVMRARDPGAKAIVFSQFTSMLELIGFRLEQVREGCVCDLAFAGDGGLRWVAVCHNFG